MRIIQLRRPYIDYRVYSIDVIWFVDILDRIRSKLRGALHGRQTQPGGEDHSSFQKENKGLPTPQGRVIIIIFHYAPPPCSLVVCNRIRGWGGRTVSLQFYNIAMQWYDWNNLRFNLMSSKLERTRIFFWLQYDLGRVVRRIIIRWKGKGKRALGGNKWDSGKIYALVKFYLKKILSCLR